MRRLYLLPLAAIGLSACLSAPSPLVPPPPSMAAPVDYTLVWSDEFDRDGVPDPGRWTYDTHRNKEGWWNNELQYYAESRAENARVEEGHLIIEARREQLAPDAYHDWGGQNYTSARMLTRGNASWLYGYIEVRAKLPCGRGLWPAIWTLPETEWKWPDHGEIDIMEYVGHQPTTFHATVHTKDRNHIGGTPYGATSRAATACGGFHTHSLHWTKDQITIGVDGIPYFAYRNIGRGHGGWPFDQPHHLILNIAVGGWGGAKGIDRAAFPAQMEVDYVRVFQSPDAPRHLAAD